MSTKVESQYCNNPEKKVANVKYFHLLLGYVLVVSLMFILFDRDY